MILFIIKYDIASVIFYLSIIILMIISFFKMYSNNRKRRKRELILNKTFSQISLSKNPIELNLWDNSSSDTTKYKLVGDSLYYNKSCVTCIPVNIWDDYYDDDSIPEGYFQQTYIYIENDEISHEMRKMYLELLLNYINENIKLNDVRMWMYYYNSEEENPGLKGSEYESLMFERWEIRVEKLTHERREKLVDELNNAKLSIDNIPFDFYSES